MYAGTFWHSFAVACRAASKTPPNFTTIVYVFKIYFQYIQIIQVMQPRAEEFVCCWRTKFVAVGGTSAVVVWIERLKK